MSPAEAIVLLHFLRRSYPWIYYSSHSAEGDFVASVTRLYRDGY
jgi:hypothetical protein